MLLSLLGEISHSLLCSHSSWGSAFDWPPPLHVGRLRASFPHSDRMRLKEQMIWGLWLTQDRGREGYRMRVKPAAAEGSMMLQQPEVLCVLLGKLSPDHGALAVAGCTGSLEGRHGQ